MGILDILKQYSNPGTTPAGDVAGHFDAVAQQASPQDLGSGIAAALRSGATPFVRSSHRQPLRAVEPQSEGGCA
jgi:hypothetical protein